MKPLLIALASLVSLWIGAFTIAEHLEKARARQPDLQTVWHDGHQWVTGPYKAPVHHPDCPCLKKP